MANQQLIDGRCRAVLWLAMLVGCGRATPPGTLVGESEHFRLYVDPDATIPSGFEGMNGLAALETEWADVHTMLQMPDGKITYYWLSPEHVGAACGEPDEGACSWERSLEIDSPTLPNPHELNHAYMYLRKQREPVPFLAEGIAEAIACGTDVPVNVDDVPWEGVVAAPATLDDVYTQGGAFVRYLIRTHGIEMFLRYYEQSPERRDPALFAANFESFWHTTLDDAWGAFHVAPGMLSEGDTKICPCSLPPLAPSGLVANDPARAPYWTLPDPGDGTFSFTSGGVNAIAIKDCAGVRAPLIGQSLLARLGGAERRYVVSPVTTATLDFYLGDTCAAAAPYPFRPPTAVGGQLTIGVSTASAGNAATVYLNFASDISAVLGFGLEEICGSCAFDQGTCQPIAPGATPILQGPFYGRTTLHAIPGLSADVLWNYLEFYP